MEYGDTSEYRVKKINLLCYLSFFINGVIAVSTGSILKYMAENYGYSYNQIGNAVAYQSFGNLLLCLMSGLIIQRIGKKKILLIFSSLFAVSCMTITIIKSYFIVCIILFISGAAWGLCNNIIHIVIVENNSQNQKSISVLHTSYAVGSFIGPTLLSITQQYYFSRNAVMIIISGLSILVFWGFYKEYTNICFNKQKSLLLKNNIKIYNIKKYICCVLLYFGYVGIEVSINAWMVIHLTAVIQIKTETAQLILAVFWLGMLIFRLLNIFLLKKFGSSKLLIIQWMLVTLITFLLVPARNIFITCVLIMALSIFMSGISPTNAENAKQYISGNGVFSGILFAGGGLGGTVLPIIIGQASTLIGVQYIYVCITGCSIIMILTAVLNYKMDLI